MWICFLHQCVYYLYHIVAFTPIANKPELLTSHVSLHLNHVHTHLTYSHYPLNFLWYATKSGSTLFHTSTSFTLSAGFENINLLKLSGAALGARTRRTTKKTLRSMLHVECSIFFSSDIRTDMIGSSPRYIQIILASTNNITFNMKDMTQIYFER